MKHPLSHPIFFTFLLLYAVLFILKKSAVHIPLVSDHLADFLALPVVLSIALWAVRRTNHKGDAYVFHSLHILFAVLLYSFLFEWLFPQMSSRHTADPLDLIAYGAGGLLFAFVLNKQNRKKNRDPKVPELGD